MLMERPKLAQQLLKDIGLATERQPEKPRDIGLPAGQVVISADNHLEVTEDIFYENFPAHMKNRAPRVWFDKYWHIGFRDGAQQFGEDERIQFLLTSLNPSESFDRNIRKGQIMQEGIQKEIVFTQSLLAFVRHKDLEARELIFRIHNEWFASLQREDPGAFFGVGLCSNWWEESRYEAAVGQIVDLDLRTIQIPCMLKDAQGQEISLASEQMDRFWSIVEEADLPVNFHVGEDPSLAGRGGYAINYMHATSPFRRPLAQLIFGGVFDRHPRLKVVFTEGSINWVPGFLQDAEHLTDGMYGVFDWKIQQRPSDYWHSQCWATFMVDKIGLEQLDYIGADRVMWSADFPHSESTFGIGWSAMEDVVKRTTEPQARMILGDTAARLYRL